MSTIYVEGNLNRKTMKNNHNSPLITKYDTELTEADAISSKGFSLDREDFCNKTLTSFKSRYTTA